MSTAKFLTRRRVRHGSFFDDEGNEYRPASILHSQYRPAIGDKAYLGKRVNVHRCNGEIWEFWPITVERWVIKGWPDSKLPKLDYRGGRHIFVKMGK